jgi:hypothetical protein
MASKEAAIDQYRADEAILGPPGSKITKDKIKRLLHSPSHLRVKRRVYTVAYGGIAGSLLVLGTLGLSAFFGR